MALDFFVFLLVAWRFVEAPSQVGQLSDLQPQLEQPTSANTGVGHPNNNHMSNGNVSTVSLAPLGKDWSNSEKTVIGPGVYTSIEERHDHSHIEGIDA